MRRRLLAIFLLAFCLRFYRVGLPVLKEDEFDVAKASAYINLCQDCRSAPAGLKNKLISLMTNNETRENPVAAIHPWNFIADQPETRFNNRAWPQIYLVAWVQGFLGTSELTLRLLAVLFGALIIPVGFIFARQFTNSLNTALVYSLLLAVAFPLIDFSRNARIYSVFITLGLLMVYLWHRLLTEEKPPPWLLPTAWMVTAFSYWIHSLTLVLLIGIYFYSFKHSRRWFIAFSLGLLLVAGIGYVTGVDMFRRQFLGLAWPPNFQYFNWFYVLGLILLYKQRQNYLFLLSLVYLIIVTFFTSWRYGSAYVIVLWPVLLLPFLKPRFLAVVTALALVLNWGLKINYLYNGQDGRAEVNSAYQVIKDNWQTGDKIYAVKLRDYYLADLPPETEIIDLQQNPDAEFTGSGWVVWEQKKTGQINQKVLEYVKTNFTARGSGGVEIYRYEVQ